MADAAKDDREYPLEKIVNDLMGLLASLARRNSTIFVIEDIERADPGTMQFIEKLCFRAAEIPLTLVLTRRTDYRSQELSDLMNSCLAEHFTRLRLVSLTASEARMMVQFLENSTARQDAVLRMSGGNPFFIEQWIKAGTELPRKLPLPLNGIITSMLSNLTKPLRMLSETLSLFEAAQRH